MNTLVEIGLARAPSAAPNDSAQAGWQDAWHGLRLLARYRALTPLFQAATMIVVAEQFQVSVSSGPVLALLVLEVLLALATRFRLRMSKPVSAVELQLQASIDIALFTAMLYFTGGPSNPFAPLYVLPVMIVAMALPPRRLWFTAIVTMVCYAGLRWFHVPLSHPQGHGGVYELHENGMIVNYMLTSAMLVYFSTRLFAALRKHARLAADAQEAQMRSEAVAAIGALAAGSAHELGSPLSTVAIIAAELRHRYPHDGDLQGEVRLIEQQLAACNQILARMASVGGERRAQSASGARLDEFVESTVQCVRSTNAGATIITQFDGARPAPSIAVEESLRQTIANVINNAVRVSPQHVHVAVSWTQSRLQLSVTDHGPGFTPTALKTLGKGIARRQGTAGGMGVGLLLGAETLQRLGGSLTLANNDGPGACVQLQIPLASLLIDNTRAAAHAASKP
jgi:two-component system, sensor histidine kinase RegB